MSTDFYPLDQEFLPRDAVRSETIRVLATLELEKHKLRMQAVIMDSAEAKLSNGNTIAQELEKIERQMIALKSKFVDVLVTPNAGA